MPSSLPDDGPVIDPRDPLGLGDLPVSDAQDAGDAPDVPVTDTAAHDVTDPGVDPEGPRDEHPGGPDVVDEAGAAPSPAPAEDPQDLRSPEPAEVLQGAPVPEAADTPEGPAATVVRPPRSGWARLGHAMRPRSTQGQLITAGLCALLGFALVVQVRQTTETQLGALRQNDLVRLLDETTTRTDELEQEALDLQRERDELLSGSDRQQAALDAARRTAAMQGILTGRLPATGPGVRITLTEPDGEIRPATLLHVLEELRNAGAEAMELNGRRITASSSFTGTRGAVVLDGAPVVSPFRWTVIGDPDTIAPALEIPGGALVRVRADGGRGTVEKSDRVDVTAVRSPQEPVHATPVADEEK
ncbi:DUF881 domain-containing protein [Cellulomonas wangsupingiae]|uniref:DUF881 domain-containing protein n=1 Tax=Cellulomonas wangsupingiae TaxID=2968085 RepID=A0ABY5JZ53_9CELL|nr:DUF881 domain-containing protein [Cellulomonas wangsupingiae]MCC2333265.1 DUF881 domain-containing protein [Cellulomonas wangsupingiae]MCM0638118.1 DUF881 domain-containing protein [Cellulomonas wangsupingiae]UUI63469.1 DUF881 domain-containing protein [Cellulomonas wangsupingiae]